MFFIFNLVKTIFAISLLSYSDFLEKIKLTYINKIMSQLSHIKNTERGKLRFFSNVYTTFELQKYLTFGISKGFNLFLSKIRLYIRDNKGENVFHFQLG
jgi:hypothetical protein